jgi:hypothetical protein
MVQLKGKRMELVIEKKTPMEPVTFRIPPRIRRQAQALADSQQVGEREVYRAIIENFFDDVHRNRIQYCVHCNDNAEPA